MHLSFLTVVLPLGFAAVPHEPVHEPGSFPIREVSLNYLKGYLDASTGGDIAGAQCGSDRPCLDGSCCNSDGWCGFTKDHCSPNPPKSCLWNCDSNAPCGIDSPGGEHSCPLKLCCSKQGWCGTESIFCGDNSQKGYGSSAAVDPPKCDPKAGTTSNGRKVGYYQGYNTRTRKCNKVWPDQIKYQGFTHLLWAFASIDPKSFELVADDKSDYDLFPKFTELKKHGLQTWISVGGWFFSNDEHTKWIWSAMVGSDENRGKFVKSVVPFMEKYGFQGLDLDWEWPSVKDRGGNPGDKANQVKLVKELSAALGQKFGLSSVLAADYWYQQGSDPKAMEEYLDFFGFIGYDNWGAWRGSVINPHASIRDIDKNLEPIWFAQVDPKKVNLGIPYYGRGYTVKDKSCMKVNCEFKGGNRPASCAEYDGDGFMSNNAIRDLISEKGLKPELIKDHFQKQVVWDDQWMGFDDEETVIMKTNFANTHCLGGLMVWSVDFDGPLGTGESPIQTSSSVPPGSSQAPVSSKESSPSPGSSTVHSSSSPQKQSSSDQTSGPSSQTSDKVDVYPPQEIWKTANPTVECMAPCTLVLPPYPLTRNTTISWPPLTTTFLTLSGGQTVSNTSTIEYTVGTTITKYTSVVIIVQGGSTGTITTTLSIPPVTTDVINFWPISVESTDGSTHTFQPVPSLVPPPLNISVTSGIFPFPPSHYPGYNTTSYDFVLGSPTSSLIWVQPMPTYPFLLPTQSSSPTPTSPSPAPTSPSPTPTFPSPAPTSSSPTPTSSSPNPTTSASSIFLYPTSITYTSGEPKSTCNTNCGKKQCQMFGCGCGPLGLSIGPGCGGAKFPPLPPFPPFPDLPDLPEIPCGAFGCDGGCGFFGCGGGCGLLGCGGQCIVPGGCNACPLSICGGLGCKNGGCGPFPGVPMPTGGPGDQPTKCEDKDKNTITDYYVSCTSNEQTSSSCTTKWSLTLTGCGLVATTVTTEKSGGCTKAAVRLNDDQGDDHLTRPPTPSAETPTPTRTPEHWDILDPHHPTPLATVSK